MKFALFCALLLVACVQTNSADCGQGIVCREGTVCQAITLDNNGVPTTTNECISEDQIKKCNGIADGMPCDGGTCYSHACFPVVCGNGRQDVGETCDDGNATLGDGCSPLCQAEVCGNGIIDPVDITSGMPRPKEQCDDGNTLGHDGCASTCVPEVPRWRLLPGTPSERNFAAMAVDLPGRKAIMFGGFTGGFDGGVGPAMTYAFASTNDGLPLVGAANGETWQLSEGGWARIDSLFSPSPRGGHAMATAMTMDGTRTILVGGAQTDSAVFDDVWELRDGSWRQLRSLPPEMGARAGAAMAYWPAKRGVLLFGGVGTSKFFDDTWFLPDGSDEWKPYDLPPTSGAPGVRSFATLTYDPTDQRLILAGGAKTFFASSALPSWGLGDDGWQPLPGASPGNEPETYGAVSSYDPALGVVVFSGFAKGARQADLWTWRDGAWTRSGVTGPPRFGAVGGVDPITGHLQVFGGQEQAQLGCFGPCPDVTARVAGLGDPVDPDVVTYDGTTWNKRNIVDAPQYLSRQGYAYDVDRARIVVFGGETYDATFAITPTNKVYELVDHTWFEPNVTGPKPTPVTRPGVAYAAFGAVRGTYVFGGAPSSGAVVSPSNAFTRLDQDLQHETAFWSPVPTLNTPSGRAGAVMVFDQDRKRIVLFGGNDGSTTHLRDTWEYDGTDWTHVTPVGDVPLGREDAAFAYDPLHRVVLMWGGVGDGPQNGSVSIFNDLWQWDGAARTWTQIKPTFGPSARPGARFAWDARRRRMVLWGGTDTSIWEFDGTAWAYVPAFESPEAHAYSMFIQAADGGMLAHGGTINSGLTNGETLDFVRESSTQTTYTDCYSQIDEDHDGGLGCEDQDCWAYCTPWCPPSGVGSEAIACDLTQPRCGDGICQAPRENCGICPDDCECQVGP